MFLLFVSLTKYMPVECPKARKRVVLKDDSFKEYVLEQLCDLGNVECRRMFGSYGLYYRGNFFGILSKGQLYFKTSGETRPEYAQRGMAYFQPNAKQHLKNYYEVPAEVIEDAESLAEWARKAISAK